MGNRYSNKINDTIDLGQHKSFIEERVLCKEPMIRIGIFLCSKSNVPRQGIQVESELIYGLKHFVQYHNFVNYFFDNFIRLTISNSNKITLFYKDSLFIKDITTYKPILFGDSKELDQIYNLLHNNKDYDFFKNLI